MPVGCLPGEWLHYLSKLSGLTVQSFAIWPYLLQRKHFPFRGVGVLEREFMREVGRPGVVGRPDLGVVALVSPGEGVGVLDPWGD